MWRFVVEKAYTDDDSDRVYFFGYNAYQEKVSEWEYRGGRGGLHSTNPQVPPVVPIAPAQVGFKPDGIGDARTGNDNS